MDKKEYIVFDPFSGSGSRLVANIIIRVILFLLVHLVKRYKIYILLAESSLNDPGIFLRVRPGQKGSPGEK
jgi:DNA modification methylase